MSRKGPGTIEDRVGKLTDSLSPDQVAAAQELANTVDGDVLKLATYLKSQTRRQEVRDRQITRHKVALDDLQS